MSNAMRLFVWDDHTVDVARILEATRRLPGLDVCYFQHEKEALDAILTESFDFAVVDIHSNFVESEELVLSFVEGLDCDSREFVEEQLSKEYLDLCGLSDWMELGYCGLLFLALLAKQGCRYRMAYTQHGVNTSLVAALSCGPLSPLATGIITKGPDDHSLALYKISRAIEEFLVGMSDGDVPRKAIQYRVTVIEFQDHNPRTEREAELRLGIAGLDGESRVEWRLKGDDAIVFWAIAKECPKTVPREDVFRMFRKYAYRAAPMDYEGVAGESESARQRVLALRKELRTLFPAIPTLGQVTGLLYSVMTGKRGTALAAVLEDPVGVAFEVPANRPTDYFMPR